MNQERKTSIEQRAQVEQARMKIEGFVIPRGHWREIPLTEGLTRYELRKLLARGNVYVSRSGALVDAVVAVEIMEGSIRKIERRKKNG